MRQFAPRFLRHGVSRVLFLAFVTGGVGSPSFADDEAYSNPNFTWQRDRPYGVIGFPGDDFGPHWEFVRLATHPPVQEELDLAPEQIEELRAVERDLFAVDGAWSQGRKNPKFLKREYEAARRILTEEQSLRIEQIKVQRRGVQAFLHADMQETLHLTPDQVESIQTVWKKHLAKSEHGWKGDEGRRSYHQVWRHALETLTDSQRRKYFELTGPVIQP